MVLSPENAYAIDIPLRKTLKAILEIPGLLKATLEYVNSLSKQSHIISNIIQANLWKTKYAWKYSKDIVFPLILFFDELEVRNGFSGHAVADSLKLAIEDKSKIRNKQDYENDLKINKVSSTGIKEECVFHKIKDFHICENISVDMMHDILEGELVPEDDVHWQLYKYLRQSMDILLSPRVIPANAKALAQIVKQIIELYTELGGKLKPKFHNFVHYPSILLNNGPFVHFWCMRFESRHRLLKSIATSTNCNKNLLVTIAKKEMLKLCEMTHLATFEHKIKFGSIDMDKVTEFYFDDKEKCKRCIYYKEVDDRGFSFKKGIFVVLNMQNVEVEFGEILKIIWVDDELFFYVNVFEEVTFDEHYHAYVVEKCDKKIIIKQKDLPFVAPTTPCAVLSPGSIMPYRYGKQQPRDFGLLQPETLYLTFGNLAKIKIHLVLCCRPRIITRDDDCVVCIRHYGVF
ncbi:hypothetical protein TSAR_011763 [Trichomalopsis sarcophagae]|uniref:Uncharacterized protein n=1 Tax=Trichomalopsis sarcophagae TaxID=543379 RepID=A0A232EM72_9HYME|nr:hypothetical protein TSAR_011763 [Trichomalopsis sarcophagae]